jgi:uncharacterized protein YkwD
MERFIRWLKRRERPHHELRVGQLAFDSAYFVLAIVAVTILYQNTGWLNEKPILFVRLGSALLLLAGYGAIRYAKRIAINVRYGFSGLPNGIKVAIVALLFLAAFWIDNNQSAYTGQARTAFQNVALDKFNPVYLPFFWTENPRNATPSITPQDGIINRLLATPEPISDKTIQIELAILAYTNAERLTRGMPALHLDSALSKIARAHSLDMVERGFFDHNNPDGEDPTARAVRQGYPVRKELGGGWYSTGIAENIGKMATGEVIGRGYVRDDADSIAKAQVDSWMGSTGHRANLLDRTYDAIGIGVAFDGHTYYVSTQDFQ